MIEREEIDSVATTLEVKYSEVERDYVNSWLLLAIFQQPFLAERLVLKGGNALRKGYFANTRYSRDLDFSTPNGIAPEQLKTAVAAACARVTELAGIRFVEEDLAIVDKKRVSAMLGGDVEVLEVRAYFLDFYGRKQNVPLRVYMDVTQFDKLYLEPVSRPIIHGYSDAASCVGTIRCMALEEILASKLKCLLQRRHIADLFDYMRWLFFEDVPVERSKVLSVFLRKTIYERAPGAAFELLKNLPFAAMQQLWDAYIASPSTCRFGFMDGVARFTAHLEELFAGQTGSYGYRPVFFPSALRNPILAAGRDLRLMKLTYDGIERTIEPYALKFKITKGGGRGEYFFAYDRTGGRSSAPGIKTFVPEKVQRIEETDEKFEPRFEVEVTKAGEMPKDPFFRGSGRRRFIPGFGTSRVRRPVGSRPSVPAYLFRCTRCNRQFRHQKHTATLRRHKDESGFPCHGRRGVYEGRS